MKITNDVKYVGVTDRKIDLFEGQYIVPSGMLYNSYLILDECIAVIDSVADGFADEWLSNIEKELDGRIPDYLVIQHVEPDHSASATEFMKKYPDCKMVSSVKAFTMMKNFYGDDYLERRVIVSEGDTLSLGAHTLHFVTAPMVHWPEVIMSYDEKDKILFSADAFGKFGSETTGENWDDEARRYYIGIVGKYGVQVQNVLKKLGGIDVKIICALHGPVLTGDLSHYVSLYDAWSAYRPESEGIVIAYTSIYGNTKAACELLCEKIKSLSDIPVTLYDLSRCDMAEAVSSAFRYSKLVLASPTYNGMPFPKMQELLIALVERNYQSRTVAFIENGSWAPMATRQMKLALENQKNLSYTEIGVKITSALNDSSKNELDALAHELCK